ncbi:MAG: TorD/DmsD family molecular chaperone [Desulforhopalus sp.]
MQNSSKPDHIAAIYRFCAQSMQYPQPEWFSKTYLDSLNTLLDALGGETEKQRLEEVLVKSSDMLEDLQVEHTRLFINGAPHVAAPPYGSVYLEKTIRGKYSEEILTFYHSLGYTLTTEADLPDSLIHQLEFLSFLAEDNNREGEEEFLSRFFLPWFPVFSARVLEEAQHPYYQIIVSIIDFFTKEEEEYGVQLNEA